MSQPLSGALGRKVPIQQNDPTQPPKKERKRKLRRVKNSQDSNVTELPGQEPEALRSLLALVLMLIGCSVGSIGVGLVWGLGAALIAVGVVLLTIGMLTGLF